MNKRFKWSAFLLLIFNHNTITIPNNQSPSSVFVLTTTGCCSWTSFGLAGLPPGHWWCHRCVSFEPPEPQWPNLGQELHQETLQSGPQISWWAGPKKCHTSSAHLETLELRAKIYRQKQERGEQLDIKDRNTSLGALSVSTHKTHYIYLCSDLWPCTHSLDLVSLLRCCFCLLVCGTLGGKEGLQDPASFWPREKRVHVY